MGYYNDGTCGACASCSEINYGKGYCSYYRTYVDTDDSCSHYSDGSGYSSGTGCFLTTVCCEYKGLPDNCEELQTMRKFRDFYLSKTEQGKCLIDFYYTRAPYIVQKINSSPKKDEICQYIYDQIINCIKLQKEEKNEETAMAYGLMMYTVDLVCLGIKEI